MTVVREGSGECATGDALPNPAYSGNREVGFGGIQFRRGRQQSKYLQDGVSDEGRA